MLQLLFTCRCVETQTEVQVETLQRDVWRRCEDREIGGFFLRSGAFLIGLFEGSDSQVVGQVEHLIRKHKVKSVRVIHEAEIAVRDWPVWNSEILRLDDLSDTQKQRFGGLAQIVEIAVDADRKERSSN